MWDDPDLLQSKQNQNKARKKNAKSGRKMNKKWANILSTEIPLEIM